MRVPLESLLESPLYLGKLWRLLAIKDQAINCPVQRFYRSFLSVSYVSNIPFPCIVNKEEVRIENLFNTCVTPGVTD